MKEKIKLKMIGAKAHLDHAKAKLARAREQHPDFAKEVMVEKENFVFWEGYLTALEDLNNNDSCQYCGHTGTKKELESCCDEAQADGF